MQDRGPAQVCEDLRAGADVTNRHPWRPKSPIALEFHHRMETDNGHLDLNIVLEVTIAGMDGSPAPAPVDSAQEPP
jgi:hypothetical protein